MKILPPKKPFEFDSYSSVAKQIEQKLGRLLGPASLGSLPHLGLSVTSGAVVVLAVRHNFFLQLDIFQEALSTTQLHTTQHIGGLQGLLKVHLEVVAARLGS